MVAMAKEVTRPLVFFMYCIGDYLSHVHSSIGGKFCREIVKVSSPIDHGQERASGL